MKPLTNEILLKYLKDNINDNANTVIKFYTDNKDETLLVIEYSVLYKSNPYRTRIKREIFEV